MTRTLTAMFDSRQDAEEARSQLLASGVTDVDIHEHGETTTGATLSDGGESRGFFGALKDMFMPDEDRHAYSEGLRRGHFLLTAQVDETRCDDAIRILDSSSGAVDFDQRESEWRAGGWGGWDESRDLTGSDEAIPIAEERLNIGKREVDRGSVRVRSFVAETPVHEEVGLREERVDIERRPVSERVEGSADNLFQEREIEMRERGEEAVVGKEAVVTEEVRLRPEVEERVEHIDDTVRHTEVDVDDSRRDGIGTEERRTFADRDADSSLAIDSEGERINETDEERRRRLERERDLRP